jgi:hypothetical protein
VLLTPVGCPIPRRAAAKRKFHVKTQLLDLSPQGHQ